MIQQLYMHSLLLSLILFAIGAIGVIIKRDAICILVCIELMLNAANLAILSVAKLHGGVDGAVMVLFVITVAAAEAGIGLAIFIHLYKSRGSIDADDQTVLIDEKTCEIYFD